MKYISPFRELESRLNPSEDIKDWRVLISWESQKVLRRYKKVVHKIISKWIEEINMDELFMFLYTPTFLFQILTNLLIENDYNEYIAEVKQRLEWIVPTLFKVHLWDIEIYKEAKNWLEEIIDLFSDPIFYWENWLYKADKVSLASSFSWISMRQASRINSLVYPNSWGFFIALWNGGIAPWIDVFNKLYSLSWDTWFRFTTTRFSSHKLHDREPTISPSELKLIIDESEGWTIVIFDEDSDTGTTLKSIESFFLERIPKDTDLIVLSNCWSYISCYRGLV